MALGLRFRATSISTISSKSAQVVITTQVLAYVPGIVQADIQRRTPITPQHFKHVILIPTPHPVCFSGMRSGDATPSYTTAAAEPAADVAAAAP